MGTSGITHFHQSDINSPSICHVYKQSDGYPDSLGEQLKEIFGDANLVNGIRFDLENQVNGMGCAAAQFVANMKKDVGGIYMLGEEVDWSNYDYHIYHEGELPHSLDAPSKLKMKITSYGEVLFDGLICEFDSSKLYEDEE